MTEQIKSGIELIFAGMGIVFVFLIMLVFAINLMSAILQRYFPDPSRNFQNVFSGVDKTTVAAITAAIYQYRNNHD